MAPGRREREDAVVYVGHVRNGVVVFEGDPPLAEGTAVRVEPIESEGGGSSLSEKLMRVAGRAGGLPQDLARNHDHYLHGRPRR